MVAGVALALALFAPALRAQLPKGAKFFGSVTKKGVLYELWRTNSDTKCYVRVYSAQQIVLAALLGLPMPDYLYAFGTATDCNKAAAQIASSPGGKARPAAIEPRQSAPSSQGYLWILSDTAPDTAPATDDAIYAVDPSTGDTAATILTPGPIPQAIAAGNTGNWVYATIQGVPAGENGIPAHAPLVEVVSTSTLSIAQTINLPQGVTPFKPALSPDDRYIYVPVTFYNQSTTSPQGEMLVVDTQNPSTITTVPLTITTRSGQVAAPGAGTTAITPDGELLFTLCGAGFCVIDTTTGQQTAYVGYGAGLETLSDLAIDPTGSRLYLAGQTHVYAYDTATLMQIGSVLTNQNAQLGNIRVSSDGTAVFANDQNSSAVFVIDPVMLTSTEVDLAAPPPFPSGLAPTSMIVVQ
ncbi:MAG TPA: hypothetical protein VIY49_01230 [Bryobacteraceae bacterium]